MYQSPKSPLYEIQRSRKVPILVKTADSLTVVDVRCRSGNRMIKVKEAVLPANEVGVPTVGKITHPITDHFCQI